MLVKQKQDGIWCIDWVLVTLKWQWMLRFLTGCWLFYSVTWWWREYCIALTTGDVYAATMKNHVAQLGLAVFRPVSFFSWPQFSFILHAVCNVTVLWLNVYKDRAGLFSQLLCITRCLDPPAERYISPVVKSCIHQIINRNPTHMSTENSYATVCHCSSSWAFVFDVLDWQHFRGCICSPSMQRVVILLHFSLLLYHCCYHLSLNHVNCLFHSLCERFNTVLLRVKCCQTVYYCYSVYC